MRKVKVAILISGRGSNMKALVKACEEEDFPAEVVLVLSNKIDAEGLKFAESKGIKTAFLNHKDFSNTEISKEQARENFDKKVSEEIEKSELKL